MNSPSKARPYSNTNKAKGKEAEKPSTSGKTAEGKSSDSLVVVREVVESFAVALILALLFRAFVAEAFVIPTGSMAPTLMGAHKDVRCPECQFDYQCGASSEFDDLQKKNSLKITETVCPICRHQQTLDPRGNANHRTFPGDKILVSRFAYFWHQPRRWDVFVFKNPSQARQNYIKRLLGVPSERLEVRHGDVYTQPVKDATQTPTIARKPPRVVQATLQPLYDSQHLPKTLVKAGLPSAFQPYPASQAAWKVEQSSDGWSASCDAGASDKMVWMRYFHRVVNPRVWKAVIKEGKFPIDQDPYAVRLVTDFTHYNAGVLEDERSANLSTIPVAQDPCIENDGWNWISDLATEFEVQIESSSGTLVLDCVEAGVHHYCELDVGTGKAVLSQIKEGKPMEAFLDGDKFVSTLQASTSVKGPGRYRLKMANVDDQILVWINGRHQSFSGSGAYDIHRLLAAGEERPHWSPDDPLDGAPVGIGAKGLKMAVKRAQVWRDIYYIATYGDGNFTDYNNFSEAVPRSLYEDRAVAAYLARTQPKRSIDRFPNDEERYALWRDTVYSTPELWANSAILNSRRSVFFDLAERQYFPMGDNSLQSFDARAWDVPHVPERLVLGRAVLVLWPHYWNAPIPFTPNVPRMGLIR